MSKVIKYSAMIHTQGLLVIYTGVIGYLHRGYTWVAYPSSLEACMYINIDRDLHICGKVEFRISSPKPYVQMS
jgi:hypothetical protein